MADGDYSSPEMAIPNEDKERREPSVGFWISQIEAAKEAAKDYERDTKSAWDEFLGGEGGYQRSDVRKNKTRYPIYWSSVKTVQPMLYSRTPITVVERMFDDMTDNVARLGSVCLERLAQYLIRSCAFDRVMYHVRDHYIHGGKTTARVCFEAEITETPDKMYFAPLPPDPSASPVPGMPVVTQWVNNEGQLLPTDMELQQDEQGYYIETKAEDVRCKIDVLPVHYCDLLHTPNARTEEEVDFKAFKSLMTKREVAKKFGEGVANNLKFVPVGEDENEKNAPKVIPTKYATIWEIWDLRDRQVYWLEENYKEGFLKPENYEGGDPYELCGFFPCAPFMLGTVGPDDMYPVPDYVQLKPLIQQLHGLSERLRRLVRAARRRGLFDASVQQLLVLNNDDDDGDFIGVDNFQELIGEQSLDKLIKYFPVREIVEAVQEISNVIGMYEEKFNEIYGIPDIMRGVSDPRETAAAQQEKGKFLSLRASAVQREFQRLVRDTIEIMCDLALKKFPEDKLKEVMGFYRMDQKDQQIWPQVLLLLQDDEERKLRIAIETDSTITMNQNAEIEQRNYLAKTLFEGLAAVANATQGNEAFIPVVMETLMFVIRKLQQGKEIEESLRVSMEKALQPQQPKPDPVMQKAQADMAIAQMKAQADINRARVKQAADIEIASVKAQIELILLEKKTQADIYREDRKAATAEQAERLDAQHQQELKRFEAQVAALKGRIQMLLEAQKQEGEMELKEFETVAKVQQMQQPVESKPANGAGEGGDIVHIHQGPETTIVGQ